MIANKQLLSNIEQIIDYFPLRTISIVSVQLELHSSRVFPRQQEIDLKQIVDDETRTIAR